MKVENIINQTVTVIKGGAIGYINQEIVTIKDALYGIPTRCFGMINRARYLLNNEGKERYKQYKVNIPVWFPSGCIAHRDASDDHMISHTNVIALDIDNMEKGDIDKFRSEFFNKPYVIAVLKSLSENGLYVLIYVEDWKHTKGYYKYFGNLLKHTYNIDLDTNATNIARKRFISWEEDIDKWIKPLDADIEPWKLYLEDIPAPEPQPTYQPMFRKSQQEMDQSNIERTHRAMWRLLENGFDVKDYGHWYHIGCDFAAFEDGKQMFDRLCSNYKSDQVERDKINTWKSCLRNPTKIDSDMHRKWQGMAKNQLGAFWDDETPKLNLDFSVDQPPI